MTKSKNLRQKCYRYLDDLYLVDLTIDDEYKNIDLCEFASPIEGVEESS